MAVRAFMYVTEENADQDASEPAHEHVPGQDDAKAPMSWTRVHFYMISAMACSGPSSRVSVRLALDIYIEHCILHP